MTDYGIRLERSGRIALVVLDRPARLNAFDLFMIQELKRVTGILKNDLPRAVVITGAGDKAFSAGFDVNPDNPLVMDLYESLEKKDQQGIERAMKVVRDTVDDFATLPVPIIAAINGGAYGGGAELTIRCDMRIMDESAVISLSEVRLGLMPDWGGGAALAHLLGPARAADLILTAREITAEEALQTGLVNRISRKTEACTDALSLAESIAENGPCAVRSALTIIRQSCHLPLSESLELELQKAVKLVESGECIHGITAFLEKRKADFPDCP